MDTGVEKSCMCVHEIQKERSFDVTIQTKVVTCLCKNPDFLLFAREVSEKIVHIQVPLQTF